MKNQVTKHNFLYWYLSEYEMIEELGLKCMDMLIHKGSSTITPESLFDECAYIPSRICVGQEDSDKEYEISDVELI